MQNFTMQLMRALTKTITLAALVGMLTGCSLVRLGYDHGESLTYWWLDGYVDFDAAQSRLVKEQLKNLFAWHRSTQLKDYANFLAQEKKKLDHPVTSSELLTEYDGFKQRAMLLFDRLLPDLADVALSLQLNQIEHIEKKFDANNDKYREDFLQGDLEQRRQVRFEKVMEQAEYWFGNFSSEQEALIRKASDARPMNNELRMEVRLKLQKNFIRVLKKIQSEKPSHEVAMALLKEYSKDIFEHYGGVEYQTFFDASRNDTANLAMIIMNGTTQKQKAHAAKKMQKWIDNFNQLAAEAG